MTLTHEVMINQNNVGEDDFIVFVLDNEPMVVRSICSLLNSQDMRTFAFTSPTEFLEEVFECERGCIICDYRMPEMDGLEVQQKLIASGNDLPIIFLSGAANVQMTVRAFSDGAAMVIQKPFRSQQLIEEVYKAFAVSQKNWDRKRCRKRFDEVNEKEMNVLRFLVGGKINKQIGKLIGRSERTVERHKTSLLDKTQTSSIVEVVDLARRAGIELQQPPTD